MLKYTYKLIRYIDDPIRNESVNVAMLFYIPEIRILKFVARDNLGSLKKIFPNFEHAVLKKYLKNLATAFDSEAFTSKSNDLLFNQPSLNEIGFATLPLSASSIQWDVMGSGVTEDWVETFDYLNSRFVQQEVIAKSHATRTDQQIWGKFSHELKERDLLGFFSPKVVDLGGFPEKYKYTYQNGKLHCLKPLSLDLVSEDQIAEKVFKERGKGAAARAQTDETKIVLYYLLGKPSDPALSDDFEAAKVLLSESGKIFTEDNTSELPDFLQKHVDFHR